VSSSWQTDSARIAARPWVIIGCGYTGTRLARRLLQHGAEVWATRRSEKAAAELAAELAAHVRDPALHDREPALHARALDKADPGLRAFLPRGAVIVDSAPPGPSGRGGETGGDKGAWAERNLVEAAAAASAARIVYISSTGVYPPGDGSWIDESCPVDPAAGHGSARLEAETALLSHARALGVQAVSLRAVGIYGPGRGVPARLVAGTYRVIGAGHTHVNRIHVDDLVTAVMAAALIPSLPRAIYNISDDLPETSRAHADAVADILGVARPPSVPESEVDPRVVAMLGANRRVSNARMKSELGVRLAYPTWREGLAQIMAEDGLKSA
jgi:nucleoside-diphosphate-sugar epimerase